MDNNKSYIGGFKNMFASSRNVKLVIAMALIVFIVFFTLFGGCTNCGCGGCGGCGGCNKSDSDTEQVATTDSGSKNGGASSCAGGSGSDSSEKNEVVFKGEDISTSTYTDPYDDIAVSLFYPTERFSYTDDPEQLWEDWLGDAMLYCSDYAIEFSSNYYSSEYLNGESCENYDQYDEAIKSYDTFLPAFLDGNNFYHYYYGGVSYYDYPATESKFIRAAIIPKDFDPNSDSAHYDSARIAFSDEVRAILGAMKVTTAAEAPTDASGVVFHANRDGNVTTKGGDWVEPMDSTRYYEVNSLIEQPTFNLRIVGAELTDVQDEQIVTYYLEYTNKTDYFVSLNELCYYRGYQSASCDSIGNVSYGYIPAHKGETVRITESYILNEANDNVYLAVTTYDDNGDGTFSYNSDNEERYDVIIVDE